MTLHTIDAELLVTAPGSDALYDTVVPATDIVGLKLSEAAGREVASGSIVLDNPHGRYSALDSDHRIDVDDRIAVRVAREAEPQTQTIITSGFGETPFARAAFSGATVTRPWDSQPGGPFGSGPFGAISFGDTPWQTAATLVVTNWEVAGDTPSSLTLTLDVENYVFNRLREQTVNEYRALATPISGSPDAHLNAILADHVPEIDTTALPDIPQPIDYSIDKKTANKAVAELARLAHDATGESWIVGSETTALTVTSLGGLDPLWTAENDFGGLISHASAADDMVNEVRVEGGVDPVNIDDEQTVADTTTTVSSASRLETRVDSRKSELPRIDVYAVKKTGSDDDLRVRLQSDDGTGNPIEPGNTDSDIINQRETVPDGYDDWLTFQLGEHTIAPRERPHLIIDSPGSSGQNVGQNASTSEPAYKVFFSKPVIVRVPDIGSQSEYREHDATISDDNLRSFTAARNRARAELDRRALPKLEYTATAGSRRAHELSVGDVVTLDDTARRAVGDYVVTAVDHQYNGVLLETSLELRSVARFA